MRAEAGKGNISKGRQGSINDQHSRVSLRDIGRDESEIETSTDKAAAGRSRILAGSGRVCVCVRVRWRLVMSGVICQDDCQLSVGFAPAAAQQPSSPASQPAARHIRPITGPIRRKCFLSFARDGGRAGQGSAGPGGPDLQDLLESTS